MTGSPLLGHTFAPRTVTLTASRIAAFATAIGERNPIFFDVNAARAAGFRHIPAPPTLLFALSFDEQAPFAWLAEVGLDLRHLLHGEQGFTYHQPACAGDTLTFHAQVRDHYTRKGGSLTFLLRHTQVHNARGDPLAEMHNLLIQRLPEGAASAQNAAPAPGTARPPAPASASVSTAALPPLALPPITREMLNAYAAASGDNNPLHTDPDAARRSGHDDVIAHGMLVMAYAGRLICDTYPLARLRAFEGRMVAITRLGEALTCHATVSGATSGRQPLAWTVSNANGEIKLKGNAEFAAG